MQYISRLVKTKEWLLLASTGILFFPSMVSAQLNQAGGDGGALQESMANTINAINNIVIPFIIGIAFVVFVWGMFWYFIAGATSDDKKAKGKSLAIYSVLAFVLMIIFWGVVNLLSTSTGLEGDTLDDSTIFSPFQIQNP